MEKQVIEVNGSHFIVHMRQSEPNFNMRWEGTLYFAQGYQRSGDSELLYGYMSDSERSGNVYLELNEDCKKAFDFSFCWRGVWEDRIYMKNDEELYCGDLRDISAAWDRLEVILKERIRHDNPDYDCFED